MPAKRDFPELSFEMQHIADAMPGGKVNIVDDGPCIILSNTRMEVVADRTDEEDPDCDDFIVRTAEAEDEDDLAAFTTALGD